MMAAQSILKSQQVDTSQKNPDSIKIVVSAFMDSPLKEMPSIVQPPTINIYDIQPESLEAEISASRLTTDNNEFTDAKDQL